MISKDTLFNDLPHEIKQKIIKIRNMGASTPFAAPPLQIKDMGTIIVPSVQSIHREAVRLHKAIRALRPTNVEAELAKKSAEFKDFVETYKASVGEKDFIGAMDKTVQLLEARFSKLCK